MRPIRITLIVFAVLFTLGMLSSANALPGGKKSPEQEASEREDKATARYNDGVKKMEQAKEMWAKGDTAKAIKQYEKAVEKYQQALEYKPDFPEALNNLGYSLRKSGHFLDALKYYDKAIALRPDYVEAHEYRGHAYLGLNRIDDAKKEYDFLMKHDPKEAAELKAAIDEWEKTRGASKGSGW